MDEQQRDIAYLESIEKRYEDLCKHIDKLYCDTFGLAWLNVPIEMAVELLAQHAKPEWERKESELFARKQAVISS